MKKRNSIQYLFLAALLSFMGTNVNASDLTSVTVRDALSSDARYSMTEVNDEPVTTEEVKAIVEKAKKNGENWTEDEWKEAYKTVFRALKPMFQVLSDMRNVNDDASEEEQMALINELAVKLKDYEEIINQLDEFEKITESSEIGKRLSEDEEFMKEMEKELGFEEGFFDNLQTTPAI